MYEKHEIELRLKQRAQEISREFNNADIIIIAADQREARINRTMVASSFGRENPCKLRDLMGILEAAKQIEAYKHFDQFKLT